MDTFVRIAATTLSLTPAVFRATRASVDVSYVPGDELTAAATTSSERPAFTILMTPSLFRVCWAMSREPTAKNNNETKLFHIRTSPYLFKAEPSCFGKRHHHQPPAS